MVVQIGADGGLHQGSSRGDMRIVRSGHLLKRETKRLNGILEVRCERRKRVKDDFKDFWTEQREELSGH